MSLTLLSVLQSTAKSNPEKTAVKLPSSSPIPNHSLNYSQISDLVSDFQSQLNTLVSKQGVTVSSSLINGIEFVGSFLAIGGQRLISAPLNPNYSHSEILFYLQDTSSALLLLPQGSLKKSPPPPTVSAAREAKVKLAEVVFNPKTNKLDLIKEGESKRCGNGQIKSPQGEDVALVLHTSGTTGKPKGVPLTHANLTKTMSNIVSTYNLTSSDSTYLVMPLFHVHGLLCGLLGTFNSAGTVVIPPKFSASNFWKEFRENSCNWYTAVPTIHQMLLNTPLAEGESYPKLRFIRSCSSSLSPVTFHALEKRFDAPVLEAYAMTEAAHQMTSNPLPPLSRKPGSVGLGQGVEVKILDQEGREVAQGKEGEVCIRGSNVTKGYLNNEKANAESFVKNKENDGFFRTGDQGKKDKEGYVFLTGRIKELINRGGEKISPLEIDSALLSISGVNEAVSFSIPDETYGELVGAAVVLKFGSNLNEESIKKELNGQISNFKIPKRIWIAESIPKTATGKIQRRNVATTFLRKDGAKL